MQCSTPLCFKYCNNSSSFCSKCLKNYYDYCNNVHKYNFNLKTLNQYEFHSSDKTEFQTTPSTVTPSAVTPSATTPSTVTPSSTIDYSIEDDPDFANEMFVLYGKNNLKSSDDALLIEIC
jgi:hypothetical protein